MENEDEVKNVSFAMELVKENNDKSQKICSLCKLFAVMWFVTFLTLIGVTCYTIYLLNDIGTIQETTITQENEDGYNSYIGNDGDITNGETKNKEN